VPLNKAMEPSSRSFQRGRMLLGFRPGDRRLGRSRRHASTRLGGVAHVVHLKKWTV
jgi:hypothetical protein